MDGEHLAFLSVKYHVPRRLSVKRTVSGIATVHFVPLGCANDVELAKVSGRQSILDFRVYGATLEKRVQIERQSATHSAR